MMRDPLLFVNSVDGARHALTPQQIVIAGYTGRDQAAVERHIAELRTMGVTAPESTPTFFDVSPCVVTSAPFILVRERFTSGEVEPVVVMCGGRVFLTVGSDHTDRTLERQDILASKRACPKVVGQQFVPVGDVPDWDRGELLSYVDDEPEPYQRGHLGDLRSLENLLDLLRRRGTPLSEGGIVFLGTVPVIGEMRPASRFCGRIRWPGGGPVLELSYEIRLTS